ncbi:MAG TPA: response regulator [Gemmatimonadales bacterium]|nr:response regulator [Gemmatimonadales bacterium]
MSRLHVLHLEDSEPDGELIARRLTTEGVAAQIVRVATLPAFRNALAAGGFDLIISDYSLPGADGLQALAVAIELAPHIPFLMVTGTIGEEKAAAALKAGATDFILKDRLERLAPAARRALAEVAERRQRQLAEEALRQNEAQLRAVFDGAPIGMTILTADLGFVRVNAALCRLLGYTVLELHERTLAAVAHAEDRKDLAQRLARLFQDGVPVAAEYRLRTKADEIVMVKITTALLSAEPDPQAVAMIEDVSEQKRLGAQLRQAQKMEAVGQLTSGIAHDFNNLLTVILGCAELLRDTVSPEGREDLDAVGVAAERGREMIKKLMGFSRHMALELKPLDLGTLLTDMAKTLTRVLPASIRVQFAPATGSQVVIADAGAVEQILFNLATNARDAMPDGGTLSIVTRYPPATRGSYLSVAVTDTGHGMDRPTLERAFEPFFTTKPAGRGTGLGMAMIKSLMDQQHGSVTVDSAPGRGTTVEFFLPLAPAGAIRSPSGEWRAPAAAAASGTILIAEDEEPLRRVAKRVLEREGYTVLVATNGKEALDLIRARPVDLVISDLMMPQMTGLEFYHALRGDRINVKFLFTSGHAPDDLRSSPEFGTILHMMPKPWDVPHLLAKVRELLGV